MPALLFQISWKQFQILFFLFCRQNSRMHIAYWPHNSFCASIFFTYMCDVIRHRILTKNCYWIRKNFILSYTCNKIIVLLGIAHDHTLFLPTLWFYPQVKHKRKFCSNLIPAYCRKSTFYCITYYITYFCSKIAVLTGMSYVF